MSDDHKPSNGTLVFWTHAGKLVDLASVSVMASLMHLKITLIHRGNKEIKVNTAETDLIHATLPETIINKIRAVSHRMNVSIAKWWKYHWKLVFFQSTSPEDLIVLFDHLVWHHDGSISFEQTARKLMDSAMLTNVQQFQIACTYCFIDDVNRLKETLSPDEIHLATESSCTDVDPFLEYWRCKIRRMTNYECQTNTITDIFNELIQFDCSGKYYNHWPVVEYFWKQSPNEEEFLDKAEQLIYYVPNGPLVELVWHLLPKLTCSQLDSIIRKFGDAIMLCFAEEPNYVEYAMLTWKRVVNLIDDDSLNRLLHSVTDIDQDYVEDLLRQMWLCMSKQQKKFVANQQEFNYVAKWFERYEREYNSPNHHLIVDVFLLWDSERRCQYWKANWSDLVIGQMKHKNKIEELMKIIFDSNENIATFKRTVMTDYSSIRIDCEVLLEWGNFDELQNYLNFCTDDQDLIRNLKKQIITSMPKDDLFDVLCDCCDDKELHAKFEYFLRDIFTIDEMKDFQKDVIISSLEKIAEMLSDGSVHQIIRCIEKYLSNEEDLCAIKLHLIKYSREHHIAKNIEMADWVHFLTWCMDGSNSLTKRLKISLQPTEAEVSDDVEMKELSIYESFCNNFLSD